jgi:hypothetical protein
MKCTTRAYRLAVRLVCTSRVRCNAWPTLNHWITSRIRTNCSTHFTLGRSTGIADRSSLCLQQFFFWLACSKSPPSDTLSTDQMSNFILQKYLSSKRVSIIYHYYHYSSTITNTIIQWNFLGQTVASGCEVFPTFQKLPPSQSSGGFWHLVIGLGATKPPAHPEDRDAVISWNVGKLSHSHAAVCPRKLHWILSSRNIQDL